MTDHHPPHTYSISNMPLGENPCVSNSAGLKLVDISSFPHRTIIGITRETRVPVSFFLVFFLFFVLVIVCFLWRKQSVNSQETRRHKNVNRRPNRDAYRVVIIQPLVSSYVPAFLLFCFVRNS